MVLLKSENTAPERRVQRILKRLGYRFETNVKSLPGTPDIVLLDYNVVIFVHGCFWHHHNCCRGRLPRRNRQEWKRYFKYTETRIAKSIKKLENLGWIVYVLWECEIYIPGEVERKLYLMG